ncbi:MULTISPECIES: nucleotide disphospho-sugar-binding domain-containing protein [unclassified Nonomuraea]|uniref:nucleotide disphospho-sugar-binding domain-containing protein n=1 Tax=unclassified Nonomuraea TaxID=2593643 RepID=UPI0033EB9955
MRVMITMWAWGPSHYQPLVPLAWAFRLAGHDVMIATQPRLTRHVLRSGLPAMPLGTDEEVSAAVERFLKPGALPRKVQVGGKTESRTIRDFAQIAEAMAGPLTDAVRAWRPDLIVFEETTYAAPLVAELTGVPAVRHLLGLDCLSPLRWTESPALAELTERLGLGMVDLAGRVTVDACPPSMQVEGDFPRQLMRYVPYNGTAELPSWLDGGKRPRVCVTWGTSMYRFEYYDFVAGKIIKAVAELGVDVVAALSEADRRALGPMPDNVHVAETVPLGAVLPGCDLVISQGGMGTTLTTAAFGVPHLIAPVLPDHKVNVGQLAKTGAGDVLDAGADAASIAARVAEVLATPSFADAARRVQAEIAAQPLPATVADKLVELVR